MQFAHNPLIGGVARRCVALGTQPYHGRAQFALLHKKGFIAPGVSLPKSGLVLGDHVFIGDRSTILAGQDSGVSRFEDDVAIYGDLFVQTGQGGSLHIKKGAHIQPGCHFRCYVSEVIIGVRAEIAASCSFYSFGHGMEPGVDVMSQELNSKGRIEVGDGVWLGHGVTVLDGVTIGEGAVIGAHAVVTSDIPPNAIAVGIPAKVLRFRGEGGSKEIQAGGSDS